MAEPTKDPGELGATPEQEMCEHCSSWPSLECHICDAPRLDPDELSRFYATSIERDDCSDCAGRPCAKHMAVIRG